GGLGDAVGEGAAAVTEVEVYAALAGVKHAALELAIGVEDAVGTAIEAVGGDVAGAQEAEQLADGRRCAAVMHHHPHLPVLRAALGELGGLDGAAEGLKAVLADEAAGLADFDAEHEAGVGEHAAGGELGLEVGEVAGLAVGVAGEADAGDVDEGVDASADVAL